MIRTSLLALSALLFATACTGESKEPAEVKTQAVAHYLANEGVMIVHDDTKVVFDPLFDKTFGYYQQMPENMKAAFLAGTAPYDNIDAVFISHYHDDHFSPSEMLSYLVQQPDVRLYAPNEAVTALMALAETEEQQDVSSRITSVALAYGDAPVSFTFGDIFIEAVRIPHAGWPEPRRAAVENIAWRVTLEGETTVLHMGDADPNDAHYAKHPDHWAEHHTDMAFPPYWYLLSERGQKIMDERINPKATVGVHVPTEIPSDPKERPREYRDLDLFTQPGETRQIPQDVEKED
jgi:L-ascorbate metabolism protein UlaG (beta-lactamase superfamily)